MKESRIKKKGGSRDERRANEQQGSPFVSGLHVTQYNEARPVSVFGCGQWPQLERRYCDVMLDDLWGGRSLTSQSI